MTNLKSLLKKGKKYYDKILLEKFPKPFFNLKDSLPTTIFGAGTVGKTILSILEKQKIKVTAIADNNAELWGSSLKKIKIISPRELYRKYFHSRIIIASVIYEKEIYDLLKKQKFPFLYPLSYLNYQYPKIFNFRDYHERYLSLFEKKNLSKIIKTYKLFEEKKSKEVFSYLIKLRLAHYFQIRRDKVTSFQLQYFDPEIVSFEKQEIFLDGGAYIGEVTKRFCEIVGNNFKKIYAFEPDRLNYKYLYRTVKKLKNKRIFPVQSGLYNKTTKIKFYQSGTPESCIGEKGKFSSFSGNLKKIKPVILPVISIDKYFENQKPPTFIKMDIEGSEINALLGAKKIIKKYKPKLAICVYHKPTDLWEIPLLTKKLNPDYRLYLRHYSREIGETVCYAVC